MYKLKDIISSGGTNTKINKAIDRYELSKDEKKDIISTIKTNVSQGGIVEDENTRVIKGNDFYWKMPEVESEYYSAACLIIASGIELMVDVVYEGVLDSGGSKLRVGGGCFSGVAGLAYDGNVVIRCYAFREKSFSAINGDKFSSIVEALMFLQGITEENALAYMTKLGFTRITKEEFYNLG